MCSDYETIFLSRETYEPYVNNQSASIDRSACFPFFAGLEFWQGLARGTEIYGSEPIGSCDSQKFITVV
jgi:hypothetical protein